MRRKTTSALLSLAWAILALTTVPAARAAWVANGVPLSPDASNYRPCIIPDGANGSIIAWHGGTGSDIFARRVLADGSPAPGWPAASPLTVCAATGLQEQPVLVADLAGGALVFWQDARNGSDYDIYAQHVDGAGRVVSGAEASWIADGIPVSSATGSQYVPAAVSDDAGGAIVVWQDGRHGAGNYDVYAQRVDGDGNLLWAPAGVPVCIAPNNQINPVLVADGAGGVFVAWQDYRKGSEYDIYVQHLNAAGAIVPNGRWLADGLGACVASNSQFYPVLAADGVGGVYVAWQDFRTGTDNHIYAQRLGGNGTVPTGWPSDGTPVCQAQYSQYFPSVTGDGASGLYLAWQDYRTGTTNHIYAQHLTPANTGWTPDGVPVSLASNGQFSPQIAGDGAGGAFVAWYDSRGGSTNDVYLHQLSARGTLNPAWDRDGFGVCLAPNTQQYPVLVTSAAGTAITTWQDLRSGGLTTAAIYAQQASGATQAGVGGGDSQAAKLFPARPNPFHGATSLRLTLPVAGFVRAEVLDVVGRRIRTLAAQSFAAGTHELAWDGTSARGGRVAPGVYLVRVQWPGSQLTQRIVRLP